MGSLLHSLPPEIFFNGVVSHLSNRDLLSLSLTSKALHNVIFDNDLLWRYRLSDWPPLHHFSQASKTSATHSVMVNSEIVPHIFTRLLGTMALHSILKVCLDDTEIHARTLCLVLLKCPSLRELSARNCGDTLFIEAICRRLDMLLSSSVHIDNNSLLFPNLKYLKIYGAQWLGDPTSNTNLSSLRARLRRLTGSISDSILDIRDCSGCGRAALEHPPKACSSCGDARPICSPCTRSCAVCLLRFCTPCTRFHDHMAFTPFILSEEICMVCQQDVVVCRDCIPRTACVRCSKVVCERCARIWNQRAMMRACARGGCNNVPMCRFCFRGWRCKGCGEWSCWMCGPGVGCARCFARYCARCDAEVHASICSMKAIEGG